MNRSGTMHRGPDGRLYIVGAQGCAEVSETSSGQASAEPSPIRLTHTAYDDHEAARCVVIP